MSSSLTGNIFETQSNGFLFCLIEGINKHTSKSLNNGSSYLGQTNIKYSLKKKLGMRTSLTFPFALQDSRIAEKE